SGIYAILVNNHQYLVISELFAAQALIGRGTKVWLAYPENDPGRQVVIKDSWVYAYLPKESDFLESIRHIRHAPALYDSSVVTNTLAIRFGWSTDSECRKK
ncbi:hypothetical protein C0991_002862, partial [Blastosporella zonata]